MDGLALLCNLHADGPLSLRRLRRAGLRTLDLIADASPSALTGVLRASPTQVRRFRNEAVLLRERLRDAALEPEHVRSSAAPGELQPSRGLVLRQPEAFDLHGPESASVPIVPVVLVEPDAPAPAPEPPAVREAPPERDTASGQAEVAGSALSSGAIPGLDARVCERLVRARLQVQIKARDRVQAKRLDTDRDVGPLLLNSRQEIVGD